jgi:hypothetical protein
MAEWVVFQIPADFQLSSLDGQKLNLATKELQNVGNGKLLVSQAASDHILPLREKKGKLRVAGKLTKSVQIIKSR